MTDPRGTLIAALAGKGWTLTELHRRAKPGCSRVSLHRKLLGYSKDGEHVYQSIGVDEYRKLARTLGVLTREDAAHLDRIGKLAGLGLRGAA